MSASYDSRVALYTTSEAAAADMERLSRRAPVETDIHHASGRVFLYRKADEANPLSQRKVFCRDRRWRGWSRCVWPTEGLPE